MWPRASTNSSCSCACAERGEASGKRLPVNLGVVLDRGKAMDGAGREAVVALRAMVGRLEPDDRISLTVSGDMVDRCC